MGGVLGSATVSERLKMRKSLGIYYYQDIVFDAEVNNNATNIRGVSTSFIILYYFWLQSYTNADLKIPIYSFWYKSTTLEILHSQSWEFSSYLFHAKFGKSLFANIQKK